MALVLLIDGDGKTRAQSREALMFGGHMTDMAETGAEALDMIARKKYQCVVTDTDLPDMDGISLCEAIRRKTQAPLLFLSEADAPEVRIRAYEAGCDGFMQKPCGADVLCLWVESKAKQYRTAANGIRDG